MTTLLIKPNEGGTAVVTLAFTDEEGTTVVPVSATWQLQKTDGTIINNRSFANCSFTGTKVVLSGLDLSITDSSDSGVRIFAIHVRYNSNIGSNLNITDEIKFKINRLVSQL